MGSPCVLHSAYGAFPLRRPIDKDTGDSCNFRASIDPGMVGPTLHHDIAQVSASIKLNNDYEGAELEFPRQKFSNREIPVGHMLAWPSLVTHPHLSTPITRGVKYSATVWFELPIITG